MRPPLIPDDDTRRKLLDAAGEIFAQQGFQHATVRDICAKAGANIAAINYHFGDKKALYLEVIREAKRFAQSHYPDMSQMDASLPVEERIARFIRTFCLCLLDRSRPAWHGRLMAREIADPEASGGAGLTLMVEEFIRPNCQFLEAMLTEALFGPRVASRRLSHKQTHLVRTCVASIYGQCLHYHNGRSVLMKLYPDELPPQDQIETLSDSIVAFTLGALSALRIAEAQPLRKKSLSKAKR